MMEPTIYVLSSISHIHYSLFSRPVDLNLGHTEKKKNSTHLGSDNTCMLQKHKYILLFPML